MSTDQTRLKIDLARKLVELHAPDEIPYFETLAEERCPIDLEDTDDPFAFGIGEFLPAITPIALNLASSALIFMTGKIAEAAGDTIIDKTKQTIEGWFNKPPTERKFKIPPHQQEALVALLFNEALKQGVGVELATRLSSDFVQRVLKND
ncbi:hypothetical protein [Pseudomonas fluorescens]|uniref:Uncharacterized protein n=1 Tax=Pseudomonas fluorescens TaxID=294 RepID=A0A5E7CGM4_PSEFL|nr:hypothetical protein [Pseudomonas fluorescens]VVO04109.1 hypothetical protein PS710_02907 [Pseudomonas fluorescens]